MTEKNFKKNHYNSSFCMFDVQPHVYCWRHSNVVLKTLYGWYLWWFTCSKKFSGRIGSSLKKVNTHTRMHLVTVSRILIHEMRVVLMGVTLKWHLSLFPRCDDVKRSIDFFFSYCLFFFGINKMNCKSINYWLLPLYTLHSVEPELPYLLPFLGAS